MKQKTNINKCDILYVQHLYLRYVKNVFAAFESIDLSRMAMQIFLHAGTFRLLISMLYGTRRNISLGSMLMPSPFSTIAMIE